MKYYLPTSTLNFTCIAASRSIAPAACYSGWKLGWNSLETCEPNPRRDCLFVYDRIPSWRQKSGDKADYPLLVELDESLVHALATAELKLSDGSGVVRVCVLERPIFLKAGLYRFVFMTEQERQEVLPRLVGVPEFKVYRQDHPSRTSVLADAINGTVGTFMFTGKLRDELDALANGLTLNLDCVKDEFGEAERTMGATLGYRLGQWLKNGGGENDFSPVEPLVDGTAWMSELNSVVKDVILSAIRLQGRNFPESSDEKAALAAEWGRNCLKEMSEIRGLETFRAHFNAFLKNLQDPLGSPYRISEEKSPLIQSMAAVFYAFGKDCDTISNLIKRENILRPEIFLSLYGAVRGYTRFPNVLLSCEMYVAPVETRQIEQKKKTLIYKTGDLFDKKRTVSTLGVKDNVLAGLRAEFADYLSGLSSAGATVGTDSHLADYLIVWARIHDVQNPENAGALARVFQEELRKSLYVGRKSKKEPAPKSLIKKLCDAMLVPSKVFPGWGISKELLKVLKMDLEIRYTPKK